jgi:hypothetical protein
MTSVSEKNCDLSLFFHFREQVVFQWGQIRRIGCVIKTLEAKVGHFLPGCKFPVSRVILVQEQDPNWRNSCGGFPLQISPIAPVDMSNSAR